MTFVLLKPWNGDPEGSWWKWNEKKMKLINFMGGGFDIDENSDYWSTAIVDRDCTSWHDIYVKYGQNPLLGDIHSFSVWISPEGEFYKADAHAVTARGIVSLVYGVELDPLDIDVAEDYLIERHWIKATRGLMWPIYLEHIKKWRMTDQTFKSLLKYCEQHHLKVPKKVEIIRKEITK